MPSFFARARRWMRPAPPPPDIHALARAGSLEGMARALARQPRLAVARDGLELTPLGALLTGWGGPGVPWSSRREAAAWWLAQGWPAPDQCRDARPALAVAPADPVIVSALLARLPPLDCARASWRAAFALPWRAQSLPDLRQVLDALACRGALGAPAFTAHLLQALPRQPLGGAFREQPRAALGLVMDACGLHPQDLLPALRARACQTPADVGLLGQGLLALPTRYWAGASARALASSRESLAVLSVWLAHPRAPADWQAPLGAALAAHGLAGNLPAPTPGIGRPARL